MKAALGALVAVLALPGAARATTYQVNTTADHAADACAQPPAGDCTLRDALNGGGNGVSVSDVFVVPAGTYQLTQGELVLAAGTLQGAGARSTIIRAAPSNRVMRIGTEATAGISGVTITGGVAPSASNGGQGGGIYVNAAAALSLADSAVVGNSATSGGGIMTDGSRALVLTRTTVAGNQATGGLAGGIDVDSGVPATLTNSTVSGNTASGGRADDGGGIRTNGFLTLNSTTVAGNVVLAGFGSTGGAGLHQGLGVGSGPTPTTAINDSIIAGNSGGLECDGDAGRIAAFTGDHNLDDDSSCGFTALGDKPGVNPLLGPLGNRGGPSDTHSLGATSPALNAADSARCPATDQRGVSRPQLGGCDMGASEYVAPKLIVRTTVVNDSGGAATPASLSVHVTRSGAEVSGSPKPGTAAGTTYTLTPGSYVVSAALAGYSVSRGGACSAAGAVALAENQTRTCTVVANDNTVVSSQLPPPVIHKRVNLLRARGTVKIKRPGAKKYKLLKVGEQVPLGTIVDTRSGRVTLIAASNGNGGTAKAVFYGGIFKLGQTKAKKPVTELTLVEKLSCKASSGKASAAAKKKKKRRLWGDGKGKFRTKGQFSSATVRGTKWLVEDRCTSTLTRVKRGKVAVRDFVKRKTVLVKAGKKYVARSR